MAGPAIIERRRRPLETGAYNKRMAAEGDWGELITADTVIRDADSGEPVIVYLVLPEDETADDVREVLRRTTYARAARTRGLATTSAVFGNMPRNTIRRDYCTRTGLAQRDPDGEQTLERYARLVAAYYERYHPTLFAEHERVVERVLPEWRLERTPFTSGIINKNNPLRYHHDAGNFAGVWSNMLVFKHRCAGGYLAVPEYGLALEVADNSLTMFDGQGLLHGVTPFRLLDGKGYRYSIVYYSLQQMWHCETPDGEITRYQQVRTRRERKRAGVAPVGEPTA